MIYLVGALASILSLIAQSNSPKITQPTKSNPVAPGQEKDVLYSLQGELIHGKMLNDSLTLHTAYGSIRLKREWLKEIAIDKKPGNADWIKTTNRNMFIGFLNEPIDFQTKPETQTRWNKHSIDRIVLHQQTTESHGQFLVLKNGDMISGQLMNWNPQSELGHGSLVEDLQNIELVQFVKGAFDLRILLRSGQEVGATLNKDFLNIELDLRHSLTLPRSQIQTLYPQTSTLPSPVRKEFSEDHSMLGNTSTEPPAPTPEGMVWIPPGRFQLGSSLPEKGRDLDEDPPTDVTLTQGFWMNQYEVTQAEYLKIIGINPSGYPGPMDLPVEKVTWNEAVTYCTKLTLIEQEAGRLPTGFIYRLPTETEWEYACRAGSITRFHFSDDLAETELKAYAWYIENSNSSTHPVGKLKPNDWGLYDMHGNVWEWCMDIWQDAYPGGSVKDYSGPSEGWLRVARGGSWLYAASNCRSANRDSYGPDNRCSDIGFRVVLAPELRE